MDLENRDSDHDQQQAFLPKSHEDVEQDDISFTEKASQNTTATIWRRRFRLILEILMALTIVGLLLRPLKVMDWNTKAKPSPVPDFPRKTYTFLEDTKYINEEMFASTEDTLHTLHGWIPLSSDGRGYVQIKDPESFDLGEPYTIDNPHTSESEPVYMMSIYHQLHCLSYLIKNYQQAINGTTINQEVVHHSAHCFDYIRQSIMCNADTSLEGKTEAGPGWGSRHVCKDYEAVLGWANEMTVVRWKGNMPGESTL